MLKRVRIAAATYMLTAGDWQFPWGFIVAKAHHIRRRLGSVALAWAAATALLGSAVAGAVPYPLPPGYFPSYDTGYALMTALAGVKYHLFPSTDMYPVCQNELRIARSEYPPADADGFVAGCIDAGRNSLGIFYPCDRNGDDPVCPRRP